MYHSIRHHVREAGPFKEPCHSCFLPKSASDSTTYSRSLLFSRVRCDTTAVVSLTDCSAHVNCPSTHVDRDVAARLTLYGAQETSLLVERVAAAVDVVAVSCGERESGCVCVWVRGSHAAAAAAMLLEVAAAVVAALLLCRRLCSRIPVFCRGCCCNFGSGGGKRKNLY